jgi:hypothetical protein
MGRSFLPFPKALRWNSREIANKAGVPSNTRANPGMSARHTFGMLKDKSFSRMPTKRKVPFITTPTRTATASSRRPNTTRRLPAQAHSAQTGRIHSALTGVAHALITGELHDGSEICLRVNLHEQLREEYAAEKYPVLGDSRCV